MMFGDIKLGDAIFVLHSNNTMETEIVKNISSHNGFITLDFETSLLSVKADPNKSIYFDEDADVVLFSEKHNLSSVVKTKDW